MFDSKTMKTITRGKNFDRSLTSFSPKRISLCCPRENKWTIPKDWGENRIGMALSSIWSRSEGRKTFDTKGERTIWNNSFKLPPITFPLLLLEHCVFSLFSLFALFFSPCIAFELTEIDTIRWFHRWNFFKSPMERPCERFIHRVFSLLQRSKWRWRSDFQRSIAFSSLGRSDVTRSSLDGKWTEE